MIHLTETLAVHTIEDFLSPTEVNRLNHAVDKFLDATGWRPSRSAEVVRLPENVQDIMGNALRRNLPAVQRVVPSVSGAAAWEYVELSPGQAVPSHLDGIGPDPMAYPHRIARMSVVIADAARGGDFYVETTSSELPWNPGPTGGNGYDPRMRFTRIATHESVEDGDESAGWISHTPRTRWTTTAGVGVAVVYGAQLIHGVTPVVSGKVRKLITNLTDQPV
ncbi:hypothetical protein GCM10012275_16380 [Longimycelium tulufanense]|uniref:Uncharacterized protein n=1 Tax=Longimycelium tulufanense TaxID=907463 RepID=A0A8J3CCH6_9PSEU|nr:hypothetical protein [Longimycelium tulufanense]GGM46099.1 hypothetical protein GCM10012275_16380 [Longimycelium tulufanense]